MAAHAINLSTAWDTLAGLPEGGGSEPPETWIRRFGRPNGLEAVERVRLVVESPACGLALAFNGHLLPRVPAHATRWEADITDRLLERNELTLVPDVDSLRGGGAAKTDAKRSDRRPLPVPLGRVRLEIGNDASCRDEASARGSA